MNTRFLAGFKCILAIGLFRPLAVWSAENVTIQNTTYTNGQSLSIYAGVAITASPNVVVNDGANVSFMAGERVVLGPGFRVNAGGLFRAWGGPDTIPPSAPTNLASSSQSSTSVTLTWTGSLDNFSVVAYDVYRTRDGVTHLLPPSPTGTAFTDTHVQPGVTYSYSVRARDAAGNVSAASTAVFVTTNAVVDTDADGIPDSLEVLFGSQSNPAASVDSALTLKPHRPLQ